MDGKKLNPRRYQNQLNTVLEEIEKYNLQIAEMESNIKLKNKKVTKDRNTQFCELYKSFSKKILIKYKIEMIIGMFIRQKEKSMEVKISQLEELNEKLKKRIQTLVEEIEELKRLLGAKTIENKEEEKETNTEIKVETNKSRTSVFKKYSGRSTSQGYARVIRRSNEPVNVIVSTTKISYRRRNEGNI